MKPSRKRKTAYMLALVLGVTSAVGSIPSTIAKADETVEAADTPATTDEPTTIEQSEQAEQTGQTETTATNSDNVNDNQEPVTEEATEPTTTAAESSSSTSSDTSHKYTLPTNLKWDSSKGGHLSFQINDATRGYWELEVHGENTDDSVGNVYFLDSLGEKYGTGYVYTMDVANCFSISGDYKFHIGIATSDSSDDMEWTDFSEAFSYDAKNNQLSTPTSPAWSTSKQNTATWIGVTGVESYELDLLRDGEPISAYEGGIESPFEIPNDIVDVDLHKYQFRVRALSEDLNKNAHSDWSELSNVLTNNLTTQTAANVIAEAVSKGEPDIIKNQYSSDSEKEILRTTIQNSSAVQEQIKTLEDTYTKNNNIKVETPISDDARIDASKVEVIGAGLAAKNKDCSIGLQIKETDRTLTEYNTDLYSNIYSFEMNLVEEDGTTSTEITELDIPVTITLPLPSNTNYATLRILHFLNNGEIEVITPAVVDGKAKFTITHFSTFAFADVKTTTSGTTTSRNSSSSSSSGNSSSSPSGDSSGNHSSGSSSGSSGSSSKIRSTGSSKAYYSKIGKTSVQYDSSALSYKAKTAKVPNTVKIGKKTYKVTAISSNAFTGYDKLTSVTISKNVKRIDKNAFSGCKKLKAITINSKKLTAKKVKGAFNDSSITTIYVPKDKVKAYKKIFTKKNVGQKVAVKAIK